MKILCSNIIENQYCGNLQNPAIDGEVCKECGNHLSFDNMTVYSEDKKKRYYIGFNQDRTQSKIVLAEKWYEAEEFLFPLTDIYLANYKEVLSIK